MLRSSGLGRTWEPAGEKAGLTGSKVNSSLVNIGCLGVDLNDEGVEARRVHRASLRYMAKASAFKKAAFPFIAICQSNGRQYYFAW